MLIFATAVVYLGALSAVAAAVDRARPTWTGGRLRPVVYALGLGVYCSGLAFFGAVGYAAEAGWSFLALSLGPILLLTAFRSTALKILRLSKEQNIASVADFVGARYGKSERVAGLIALAALIATLPYLALQLKAIAAAAGVMLARGFEGQVDTALFGGIAAIALAVFACLFGARQVAATERQDGLTVAVAVDSVVKLAAFVAVGAFVTWSASGGPAGLAAKAAELGHGSALSEPQAAGRWIALIVTSFSAFLLLPRMFHMAVVENRDPRDLVAASWIFPAYLVAFSLFVAPLAVAGVEAFGAPSGAAADAYVLTLPLAAGADAIAAIALLGGVSAACAMVVVECVALSVMVSNDLVMPVMLRGRGGQRRDMSRRLLAIRRVAILAVMAAAFGVALVTREAGLAALGLLALTAAAQLAPAFFGGLMWRRATGRGAIAGVATGLAFWVWTLLLPILEANGYAGAVSGLLVDQPFGLSWLGPDRMFGLSGLDPIARGVLISLSANAIAFWAASLTRAPTIAERQQAALFCGVIADGAALPAVVQAPARPPRSRATAGELVQTVARYLGPDRTETAFRGFAIARGSGLEPRAEVDLQTLRFAEHLLASAIGAASSRLVLSMLLTRRNVSSSDALRLLDHASAAMQTSRDVLQSALDHARQGVTAIDHNMKLVAWNREFRELFELPEEMIHFGVGLDDIFRFNAARGAYGPIDPEPFIADRIDRFVTKLETLRTRLHPSGRVIEIRSARMPEGGVVTTYTDISDTVAAQEALERANETLERRVRERTRELTRLNQELARAKTEADEANISKTRFLAAASHDILQPLNAARLFATSLVERTGDEGEPARLARSVDSSLDAVEEILSTLLDISRLDTGVMKPELSNFRLDELIEQIARDFAPVAGEKSLKLIALPTSLSARSDRRLLRRVLQNLVSNAIKYTTTGKVLIGCRRLKGRVRIEVWDTGLGIEPQQQKAVFREFKRLEQGARIAPGLGLGLSIVERIARVLDHPLTLRSRPGKGSTFALELPTATAVPAARAPSGLEAAAAPALRGLTALVIDNEPAIIEGMKTLLGGWGCTVFAATSQKEAEQIIHREKAEPDVMMVDYHLDNADGLETIVSLRWRLGRPIPAVLITADRSPGLQTEAADKRITVLPKPIRPAALRALLSQLMSRREAAE